MWLRFVVQLNSRQNFYITPQREYLPQDVHVCFTDMCLDYNSALVFDTVVVQTSSDCVDMQCRAADCESCTSQRQPDCIWTRYIKHRQGENYVTTSLVSGSIFNVHSNETHHQKLFKAS